ncbi:MAG: T9SS type A sorting domain-containing protein, partial [Bacteroidales bacterium]|nr:T9SS type A sorting domain-containing protein [Bacteroidales bacterium]
NIVVNNGSFSVSYILPENLEATYGTVKLSYYAEAMNTDAQGAFANLIVGGFYNGVGDHEMLKALKVYPTPTTDRITISFGKDLENVKVNLMDMSGDLIFSEERKNIAAGDKQVIDLHTSSPGLYILKITDGDRAAGFKILKQ